MYSFCCIRFGISRIDLFRDLRFLYNRICDCHIIVSYLAEASEIIIFDSFIYSIKEAFDIHEKVLVQYPLQVDHNIKRFHVYRIDLIYSMKNQWHSMIELQISNILDRFLFYTRLG